MTGSILRIVLPIKYSIGQGTTHPQEEKTIEEILRSNFKGEKDRTQCLDRFTGNNFSWALSKTITDQEHDANGNDEKVHGEKEDGKYFSDDY